MEPGLIGWLVNLSIFMVTFSFLSAQGTNLPNSDHDASVPVTLPHPISTLVLKTNSLAGRGTCRIS